MRARRGGPRRLAWACLLSVCGGAGGPFVRILSPSDLGEVAGWNVRFVLQVDGAVAEDIVCIQLTNKRVSWESFTHCAGHTVVDRNLDGFLPGVWRARAYITDVPTQSFLRRGEASGVVGSDDVAWFVVDRAQWARQTSPLGGAAYELTARRVRQVAHLVETSWRAVLREAAGASEAVIVSLANAPHVDLALNMVYSARRVGAPAAAVFAASQKAHDLLSAAGVLTLLLPEHDAGLDSHRDVQTRGFAAIATLKPLSVLAVALSGLDAVWIDTDVVFLRRPVELLAFQGDDFIIQAGGLGGRDAPRTAEQHFHVEACTGVFAARKHAPTVVRLLNATMATLALWTDAAAAGGAADVTFGDQAAMNMVLFEQRFNGLDGTDAANDANSADAAAASGALRVRVLDPLLAPGGGLFFEGPLPADGGEAALVNADPFLAHNNFIVGKSKKVRRFQDRGLWFADSKAHPFDRNLGRSCRHKLCASNCAAANVVLAGARPQRLPLPTAVSDGAAPGDAAAPDASPDATSPGGGRLYLADAGLCATAVHVVATASLGRRPWRAALVRRVVAYAARIGGADVFELTQKTCGAGSTTVADAYRGGGGDASVAGAALAFDACAKRLKLVIMRDALQHYQRVLLLDDTVAVRQDAPNLFKVVPAMAIGTTVERREVRPPEATRNCLVLACLAYNVTPPPAEGLWFNSGVFVASWVHLAMFDEIPSTFRWPLDDQWFVNAMRVRGGHALLDLGYAYNYVGSFETTNAQNAPFPAKEAWMVHATTGLLLDADSRAAYLTNIITGWDDLGL
ncbi:nucleotide-diphospho-sugar transferase-domain-containing protein [Pelagophyceae sp. CCMP2097]|nr:nucleotide-diphospho-sugar transferase-domain-containing protein [Pelagophyceae sp. CCMP2097]